MNGKKAQGVLFLVLGTLVLTMVCEPASFWPTRTPLPASGLPSASPIVRWILSTLLISAFAVSLWAVSNRALFASVVTFTLYAALCLADTVKSHYLQASLQINDLIYLPELLTFTSLLPLTLGALALTLVILLWIWTYKRSRHRLSWEARGVLLSGSLLAGLGSNLVIFWNGTEAKISELSWSSRTSTKANGIVLELLQQIPKSRILVPRGYSRERILEITSSLPSLHSPPTERPDVILFFVESLMDPSDFTLNLSRPVLPTIELLKKRAVHGYAVSPHSNGGSAESEFEVLTGMSKLFLPKNSCAYKHLVKRKLPGLVRTFKAEGYHTTAIQLVNPGFYNYQEAYLHLGFDRFIHRKKITQPRLEPYSKKVSDATLVDEILRELSRPKSRKSGGDFVMAFNLSTHHPYRKRSLRPEERFVKDGTTAPFDEIEAYLQALARLDTQLARLVEALKSRPKRTLLIVVGDHSPPLSPASRAYIRPKLSPVAPLAFRTPYLIWDNQRLPGELSPIPMLGMNFLPVMILRTAGLPRSGLFSMAETLMEKCPMVTPRGILCEGRKRPWKRLRPGLSKLVYHYKLLQYDLLFGEKYSALTSSDLSAGNKKAGPSGSASPLSQPAQMPVSPSEKSREATSASLRSGLP